jgi:hypothetical protein
MSIVMTMDGNAQLVKIVAATVPPRRFAGRLHRRQQETDQDANDGNHNQQLHQRKTACWNMGKLWLVVRGTTPNPFPSARGA